MFFTWNDKLYTITVFKKIQIFIQYSLKSIRVAIDEAIYDETVTAEAVIVHDSVESIQKVYMYIQWHSLCRILLCRELLFVLVMKY